ncbi:hypothetical protein F1B92_02665 [Campylobacter sp. FMV-PI01]|uniref:Periplasmic protein n=1 Tax=Campylobacter portucalensis TaxID=2608384 RepID=A0A6L5WGY9_9BACT|nr:hypothetical protein [Campylobacter portucalensis]MSN96106.1 hypothetical protein [Campylobacter portucalensis]
MRKIILFLVFSFLILDAKVQKLSNIMPAKCEYLNFEPGICDNACLVNLVNENKIFSFLSMYKDEFSDENLRKIYAIANNETATLSAINNLSSSDKIGVLLPQNVIGNYAKVVSNAIFSYITSQNLEIEVKFYLSGNESRYSLENVLNNIKNDGISVVIAPVTVAGAKFIANNADENILFFIPTLSYEMVGISKGNIFFGGINYQEQILKLLNTSSNKIVIFSDNSELAKTLNRYISQYNLDLFSTIFISDEKTTLLGMVDNSLDDSLIFLNLPLQKTSLVINELALNDIKPASLLSTQINYSPKLLSSTKYDYRKNLYIANIINEIPQNVLLNSFLFGVDMNYDWVAYSTAIGLDYLYSVFVNTNHTRIFKENIIGSSIDYESKIYQTNRYKFIKYNPN